MGVAYGIAAFGTWGVIPAFWKLVSDLPATEILAQRILWTVPMFLAIVWWRRGWDDLLTTAKSPGARRVLFLSGLLLATNWLVFIYAVNSGQVLDASLGYFINPFVSMLLGKVFLRERLRPLQWIAVALAAVGVAHLAVRADGFPWISLVLAGSFGLYGLLRKTVRATALSGTVVEICLLAPLALAFLIYRGSQGTLETVTDELPVWLLLVATGPITALPLLWFANAARRVTLTAVGFMQYLAPTGQSILAVAVYGEDFGASQIVTFACIWLGLAIFAVESRRRLAATAPSS